MSALSHQKRIQSLCLSYNNNYTEFSLYQEHCCSFFKSERSKITRSFRSKALDQVYHVYFLLNKSLVQHITGVCVYILFFETSGPYLVWVHTLFYSQLYTASKWLGNQSNYLGRQCGRVPCTTRRTRYPAVPGSSPALTTCWICSRSFQVQILLHAHKYPTGCLLPVWVFNPVMFHLNALFLIIGVQCLQTILTVRLSFIYTFYQFHHL